MIVGLTTFMTMAYIIFVNPAILGSKCTGLPISGVFFATRLGAVGGGATGASSVTSYVKERGGHRRGRQDGAHERGGRRALLGRAAVLAPDLGLRRLCWLPGPEGGQQIFVSPVTAPALIVVGFLMMTAVRFIPWDRFEEAIPAFLTILTLPLTFNISYVLIKLSRGKPGEIHPLLYGVALAFVWPARQNLLS